MEKRIISLVIYSSLLIIITIAGISGWWFYHNASGNLQSAVGELRDAKVTIQRMQDGFSRFTEISGIIGKSNRRVLEENRKQRELLTGLRSDRERRDREFAELNKRGRRDIERCIDSFNECERQFDELYQRHRAFGENAVP